MSLPDIPVIDIAQLDSPHTRRALDAACREWGFFHVINHGIAATTIAALHSAMASFFLQPLANKQTVERTRENPWGFYDRELTKNRKDWKEVYDIGRADGGLQVPQWPQDLPDFRQQVMRYYSASHQLCLRLMTAIAANLNTAPSKLTQCFGDNQTSFLRLNYYPPCPEGMQKNSLGIHPHTDAGALTCLSQDDQAGLEILHRGDWTLIEPVADALVINIGDIMQVWSNDHYHAVQHRVATNCSATRFSAPFFFNPGNDTDYQPLEQMTSADNPPRYRAINWGEFRRLRADGDYADFGEEVQISQYRIH
jgi:isopenicillin N synthase-like dioxygenase